MSWGRALFVSSHDVIEGVDLPHFEGRWLEGTSVKVSVLLYGVFCSKVTKFELALDVSSSESNSESICDSEDSQASSESNFDIELEDEECESRVSHCESSEDMAYADEPLADEEWLKNYEKKEEENKRLEQEHQARLDGTVQVESW